jgi:hypothetical protein
VFYVYEHTRPDTGAIFYVGKGKNLRCNRTSGRNLHWQRIVAKSKGFRARKIVEDIDEELALLIEVERISQLKELGVKLCNMTDGGEGISNPSPELRAHFSKMRTGRKHTDEAKRKISLGNKGKLHSAESYKRGGDTMRGRKFSRERKKQISEYTSGTKNGMYGKNHTEEAKELISKAILSRPKVACPHCNRVGDLANMSRWHFNNCKTQEK